MSLRRISFIVVAAFAICRLVALAVEIALAPVIAACRYLFDRDYRHSISLPKLVGFRLTKLLKPVYRESQRSNGLNFHVNALRC